MNIFLPSREEDLTTRWKLTLVVVVVIKIVGLCISVCVHVGEVCVFELCLQGGHSVYNQTTH